MKDYVKRWSVAGALSGALLALALLLLALSGPPTLAAPSADADPAILSLDVAASLPLSDTLPGAPLSRTLFFSNTNAGIITLTLEISGTPTLSLTAGVAFGQPAQTLTATAAPWTAVVTYEVAAGAGDELGVAYTAVNTNGVQATVVLTYVRDVTAPLAAILVPTAGSVLTGSQATVAGQASDAGAGVQQVQWNSDSGWQAVEQTTQVTDTVFWTATWALPLADGIPYTLSAQAQDWLGTWQTVPSTVAVVVDTVPPTASVPLPHRSPWVTTTVIYAWPASNDGSGIAGYFVQVTSTRGYSGLFFTVPPTLVFTQALDEDASYVARVRAADGAGNVGAWSAPSVSVTPDLTPPSVVSPSIAVAEVDKQWLCAVETHLYYSNTMSLERPFAVRGYSQDGAAGMARVRFSPALGIQPADDVDGFWPWQSASPTYAVGPGETRSGVISATAYDVLGNARVQTYTYELDDAGPYTASIVVEGGAEYVTHTNVTLALFAADAGCGVATMCISNSSTACTVWEPYATARGWTLGSGAQTVYAWFRDGLGNVTGPVTDTVYADFYPPTGTIVINNQATYASQVAVTLTLTATDQEMDVTKMRFRNDGGSWSNWENYATTRSNWLLRNKDGVRSVGVQFRDRAGNVSQVVSDTITLDRQPPQVHSFLINGGAEYTNQTTVTLRIDASDAIGYITQARFANDGGPWSAWETFTTPRSGWPLGAADGERSVSVQLADGAGNVSAVYSDTIWKDTRPPVVTVTVPARVAAREIPVRWQAQDPRPGSGLSGFYDVDYRQDNGPWQRWLISVTVTSRTFTSVTLELSRPHTYTFRVTAYDNAGNPGIDEGQTVAQLYGVYLPLVQRNWQWWYQFDIYEPNDTPAQAYGPLQPAFDYYSYIWDATDRSDYYYFTATQTTASAVLTNIPPNCDFDLYIYYFDGQQYVLHAYSNQYGQSNESASFSTQVGQRYFIRVYPYAGFSQQQSYHLRFTYP